MDNSLKQQFKILSITLAALALAACGGGSGNNDGGNNGSTSSSGGSSSGQYSSSSSSSSASSSSSSSSSASSSSSSSSSASSSSSSGGTAAAPAPVQKSTGLLNDIYVADGDVTVLLADGNTEVRDDLDGFSLYIFAPDVPGTGESSCTADCITNWPPLLAGENDVDEPPLTIVDREDGHRQWALRDKPLYFFANDSAAGDVNGQNAGGVWFVASGAPVAAGTASIGGEDKDALVAGYGAIKVDDGTGAVNVNKEGFVVYTFANDVAGQPSNCAAGCLANWPALVAEEGEVAVAPFSLIEHPDDNVGLQWAYRGLPLYLFAADTTAGEGVDNAAWPPLLPAPFQGQAGTVLTAVGETQQATMVEGSESVSPVAAHGFTLYTFANDTAGAASTCTSEGCLNAWPALMAGDGAEAFGPFSLIERTAGGFQWALDGLPLYFRAADSAPGENNENATWPAARILPASNDGGNFVSNGTEVDGSAEQGGMTLYFRTDDSAEGTVLFSQIQSEIFDNSSVSQRCRNCHTGADANSGSGGMNLDPEFAYAELLDSNDPRVVPFDSENSLIIQKLEGTAPGSQMPLGADPLSAGQIQMVADWIDAGAPETGLGGPAPCSGGCLTAWPPLLAVEGAVAVGNFSIFENAEGDNQWAYDGQPLYFFNGDNAPGDANGESAAWPLATE